MEQTIQNSSILDKILCLYCPKSFLNTTFRANHVEREHCCVKGRRSDRIKILNVENNENTVYPGCFYCNNRKCTKIEDLDLLYNHILSKHQDEYFGCKSCKIHFDSKNSFLVHNKICKNSIVKNDKRTVKNVTKTIAEDKNPSDQSQNNEISSIKCDNLSVEVKNKESTIIEKSIESNKMTLPTTTNAIKKKSDRSKSRNRKNLDICEKSNQSSKSSTTSTSEEYNILTRQKKNTININETCRSTQSRSTVGNKKNSKTNKNNTTPETKPLNTSGITPTKCARSKSSKTVSTNVVVAPETVEFSSTKSEPVNTEFDEDFYKNIGTHVRTNLNNYIDGKLDQISNWKKSISGESGIDDLGKEGSSTQQQCEEDKEIHEATNFIWSTPFPALLTVEQYGSEDLNTQKIKRQITKNSWKWKWDLIKKYKYVNEGGKIVKKVKQITTGQRDLSKLDMSTQLCMRSRYEKLYRQSLSNLEDNQELKEQLALRTIKSNNVEQLNSILENTLLPEILHEQNDQTVVKIEKDDSNDCIFSQQIAKHPAVSSDTPEILKMFNLGKTNETSTSNIVLSGEWARPRCYICFDCGQRFEKVKTLEDHKSSEHPYVVSAHYEMVGRENIDRKFYKNLFLPNKALLTNKNSRKDFKSISETNSFESSELSISSESSRFTVNQKETECTKCKKMIKYSNDTDVYRHILDCIGDHIWMQAKRRMKYRRSRRRRGGNRTGGPGRRNKTTSKDNESKSELKKKSESSTTPKDSTNEDDFVQRMLADLPPKRNDRKSSPKIVKSNATNSNSANLNRTKKTIEKGNIKNFFKVSKGPSSINKTSEDNCLDDDDTSEKSELRTSRLRSSKKQVIETEKSKKNSFSAIKQTKLTKNNSNVENVNRRHEENLSLKKNSKIRNLKSQSKNSNEIGNLIEDNEKSSVKDSQNIDDINICNDKLELEQKDSINSDIVNLENKEIILALENVETKKENKDIECPEGVQCKEIEVPNQTGECKATTEEHLPIEDQNISSTENNKDTTETERTDYMTSPNPMPSTSSCGMFSKKKKVKKLNDCIAMLTCKIQQKLGVNFFENVSTDILGIDKKQESELDSKIDTELESKIEIEAESKINILQESNELPKIISDSQPPSIEKSSPNTDITNSELIESKVVCNSTDNAIQSSISNESILEQHEAKSDVENLEATTKIEADIEPINLTMIADSTEVKSPDQTISEIVLEIENIKTAAEVPEKTIEEEISAKPEDLENKSKEKEDISNSETKEIITNEAVLVLEKLTDSAIEEAIQKPVNQKITKQRKVPTPKAKKPPVKAPIKKSPDLKTVMKVSIPKTKIPNLSEIISKNKPMVINNITITVDERRAFEEQKNRIMQILNKSNSLKTVKEMNLKKARDANFGMDQKLVKNTKKNTPKPAVENKKTLDKNIQSPNIDLGKIITIQNSLKTSNRIRCRRLSVCEPKLSAIINASNKNQKMRTTNNSQQNSFFDAIFDSALIMNKPIERRSPATSGKGKLKADAKKSASNTVEDANKKSDQSDKTLNESTKLKEAATLENVVKELEMNITPTNQKTPMKLLKGRRNVKANDISTENKSSDDIKEKLNVQSCSITDEKIDSTAVKEIEEIKKTEPLMKNDSKKKPVANKKNVKNVKAPVKNKRLSSSSDSYESDNEPLSNILKKVEQKHLEEVKNENKTNQIKDILSSSEKTSPIKTISVECKDQISIESMEDARKTMQESVDNISNQISKIKTPTKKAPKVPAVKTPTKRAQKFAKLNVEVFSDKIIKVDLPVTPTRKNRTPNKKLSESKLMEKDGGNINMDKKKLDLDEDEILLVEVEVPEKAIKNTSRTKASSKMYSTTEEIKEQITPVFEPVLEKSVTEPEIVLSTALPIPGKKTTKPRTPTKKQLKTLASKKIMETDISNDKNEIIQDDSPAKSQQEQECKESFTEPGVFLPMPAIKIPKPRTPTKKQLKTLASKKIVEIGSSNDKIEIQNDPTSKNQQKPEENKRIEKTIESMEKDQNYIPTMKQTIPSKNLEVIIDITDSKEENVQDQPETANKKQKKTKASKKLEEVIDIIEEEGPINTPMKKQLTPSDKPNEIIDITDSKEENVKDLPETANTKQKKTKASKKLEEVIDIIEEKDPINTPMKKQLTSSDKPKEIIDITDSMEEVLQQSPVTKSKKQKKTKASKNCEEVIDNTVEKETPIKKQVTPSKELNEIIDITDSKEEEVQESPEIKNKKQKKTKASRKLEEVIDNTEEKDQFDTSIKKLTPSDMPNEIIDITDSKEEVLQESPETKNKKQKKAKASKKLEEIITENANLIKPSTPTVAKKQPKSKASKKLTDKEVSTVNVQLETDSAKNQSTIIENIVISDTQIKSNVNDIMESTKKETTFEKDLKEISSPTTFSTKPDGNESDKQMSSPIHNLNYAETKLVSNLENVDIQKSPLSEKYSLKENVTGKENSMKLPTTPKRKPKKENTKTKKSSAKDNLLLEEPARESAVEESQSTCNESSEKEETDRDLDDKETLVAKDFEVNINNNIQEKDEFTKPLADHSLSTLPTDKPNLKRKYSSKKKGHPKTNSSSTSNPVTILDSNKNAETINKNSQLTFKSAIYDKDQNASTPKKSKSDIPLDKTPNKFSSFLMNSLNEDSFFNDDNETSDKFSDIVNNIINSSELVDLADDSSDCASKISKQTYQDPAVSKSEEILNSSIDTREIHTPNPNTTDSGDFDDRKTFSCILCCKKFRTEKSLEKHNQTQTHVSRIEKLKYSKSKKKKLLEAELKILDSASCKSILEDPKNIVKDVLMDTAFKEAETVEEINHKMRQSDTMINELGDKISFGVRTKGAMKNFDIAKHSDVSLEGGKLLVSEDLSSKMDSEYEGTSESYRKHSEKSVKTVSKVKEKVSELDKLKEISTNQRRIDNMQKVAISDEFTGNEKKKDKEKLPDLSLDDFGHDFPPSPFLESSSDKIKYPKKGMSKIRLKETTVSIPTKSLIMGKIFKKQRDRLRNESVHKNEPKNHLDELFDHLKNTDEIDDRILSCPSPRTLLKSASPVIRKEKSIEPDVNTEIEIRTNKQITQVSSDITPSSHVKVTNRKSSHKENKKSLKEIDINSENECNESLNNCDITLNGLNTSELNDDEMGIGKRKSRRKCVTKAKTLAETWSSDEYEEFHNLDVITLINEIEKADSSKKHPKKYNVLQKKIESMAGQTKVEKPKENKHSNELEKELEPEAVSDTTHPVQSHEVEVDNRNLDSSKEKSIEKEKIVIEMKEKLENDFNKLFETTKEIDKIQKDLPSIQQNICLSSGESEKKFEKTFKRFSSLEKKIADKKSNTIERPKENTEVFDLNVEEVEIEKFERRSDKSYKLGLTVEPVIKEDVDEDIAHMDQGTESEMHYESSVHEVNLSESSDEEVIQSKGRKLDLENVEPVVQPSEKPTVDSKQSGRKREKSKRNDGNSNQKSKKKHRKRPRNKPKNIAYDSDSDFELNLSKKSRFTASDFEWEREKLMIDELSNLSKKSVEKPAKRPTVKKTASEKNSHNHLKDSFSEGSSAFMNDDLSINPTTAANRTKRHSAEKLYYWSSSSSDADADENTNDKADNVNEEILPQHGWIVGDSHKKLVTLLAHAKIKNKIN